MFSKPVTVNSKDLLDLGDCSTCVLDAMAASEYESYLITDFHREDGLWQLTHHVEHAHTDVPKLTWMIPDQDMILTKDNKHPVQLECGRTVEIALFTQVTEKKAMSIAEIQQAIENNEHQPEPGENTGNIGIAPQE